MLKGCRLLLTRLYMNLFTVSVSGFVSSLGLCLAALPCTQLTTSSPHDTVGYFAMMTLGSGGSLADVRRKLQHDFWPTLLAELTVWPPIQAANFKLVASPSHQLLVVNLLTVIGA